MSEKPLENITVIDCSTIYAGPIAARILGDFGAEVIKIEHPEYGDSLRGYGDHTEEYSWKYQGRNKKSVAIDLHEEMGQKLVKELVKDSDILIENFRPGTLENWNLGWETLSEINQELIMVRTTGYGQEGPYSDMPGFGTLAEAMSGFAHLTGQSDGPPTLPPLGFADSIAAFFSTFSIMFALYWRDAENGSGQYIDTSIIEPMFSIIGEEAVKYSDTGEVSRRNGNRSKNTAPRNIYQTKDDQWIVVAGSSEGTAERILRTVGGEELVEDERFQTMEARVNNVEELDDIIQEWIANRPREEVLDKFRDRDAPVAPVNDIEDIIEDDHFQARDAFTDINDDELGEIVMPDVFPKLSKTPGGVSHTGPKLGEQTEEILLNKTGLSQSDIEQLSEEGVIGIHND